jgi:hypothetical protein
MSFQIAPLVGQDPEQVRKLDEQLAKLREQILQSRGYELEVWSGGLQKDYFSLHVDFTAHVPYGVLSTDGFRDLQAESRR